MSDHPVDQLDQAAFDVAAVNAAETLNEHGCAFVHLEPGDATRYAISIVRPREIGEIGFKLFDGSPVHGWKMTDRYYVATSFGPLYEFNPSGGYDWGYVLSHWLPHCQASYAEHTARVLARFLNTLAERMRE